eukprot:7343910-Alexandrium_andersonii.AAC.1
MHAGKRLGALEGASETTKKSASERTRAARGRFPARPRRGGKRLDAPESTRKRPNKLRKQLEGRCRARPRHAGK